MAHQDCLLIHETSENKQQKSKRGHVPTGQPFLRGSAEIRCDFLTRHQASLLPSPLMDPAGVPQSSCRLNADRLWPRAHYRQSKLTPSLDVCRHQRNKIYPCNTRLCLQNLSKQNEVAIPGHKPGLWAVPS